MMPMQFPQQPRSLSPRERAELELAETDFELAEWASMRGEKRDNVVRIVEYSPFPRAQRNQHRRVAFMRDESRSGMCLLTHDCHRKGELLRIAVRNVDGHSRLDALASVVWCEGRSDGRYWVGLSLLEAGGSRMARVRRSASEGRRRADAHGRRVGTGDPAR